MSSLKVSAISDDTQWALRPNATNVYYIRRKLAISMQMFAVPEVLDGPYCNLNVLSGTETYAAHLIFIW